MIRLIYKRLQSGHDDQGGQTIIFIAIVLFALICFFALVVNVGHRVTAKVETQNAADAAVLTGAIWNARGLNIISVLNVGMTECLAFIIMFKAFDKTYIATQATLQANKAAAEACSAVPYIGIICKIWSACLQILENTTLKIAEKMNDLMKKLTEDDKGLWQVMKWIYYAEKGVKYSFNLIGALEANKIAELNGADTYLNILDNDTIKAIEDALGIGCHVLFFPTDLAGLPVKDGKFKDLCKPTTKGGSGYKNFLCWDSALGMEVPIPGLEGTPLDGITKVRTLFGVLWELAFFCVVPPPIVYWEASVELSKMELCGTADDKHQKIENTTKCSECNQKKGDPTWSGRRVELDCNRYRQNPPQIREIGSWDDAPDLPSGQRNPCSGNTTDHLGNKPCTADCIEAPQNGPCYKYSWVLKGCTYKGEEEDVKQTNTDNKPKPIVLDTEWESKTKFTAILQKGTRDKLSYGQYRKDGETFGAETVLFNSTWAFAQAEIYNPTDADLFNQDWHVRLKPCTLDDLNISFFDKKISNILPSSIKKLLDKGIGQGLVH